MAFEIGSASGLEDLFSKIITFLTTNSSLVAATQQWEVLRQRRDNILSCTTSLPIPSSTLDRKVIHTCRYDSRSVNSDNPASSYRGTYYSGGTSTWVAGAHVTWRFRQARAVATVRLQAALAGGVAQHMFKNFRLQYSDDNSTWTTALTVSSTANYATGEWRDFAVPGTPGSHEYWRILQDSIQSATTQVAWSSMILLQADGTVANHFGSEVLFRSKGNAGADNIYTGIRSEYDDTQGWYNLFLNGYTGYDAGEQNWFKQPGALPPFEAGSNRANPMVACWDSAMPYWFAASGRSFRMGLKVSTVYQGAYMGFILPWATPNQYPYPLAIGGSLSPTDQASEKAGFWRYSAVTQRHGVFVGPGINRENNLSSSSPYPEWSTLYLRLPDGNWGGFQNRIAYGTSYETVVGPSFNPSSPYQVNGGSPRSVWPHCCNSDSANPGWTTGLKPWREVLGGGYMFQPCILLSGTAGMQVFGEFEGIYAVSGYTNGAENTSVVDGKNVVIFQNAYRSTVHEFWAMSLDA